MIGGIINGSSENAGEENAPQQTPRSAALAAARANSLQDSYGDRRSHNIKRDSFYYLQRTLESRAAGRKAASREANAVEFEDEKLMDGRSPGGRGAKSSSRGEQRKWTPRTRRDNEI